MHPSDPPSSFSIIQTDSQANNCLSPPIRSKGITQSFVESSAGKSSVPLVSPSPPTPARYSPFVLLPHPPIQLLSLPPEETSPNSLLSEYTPPIFPNTNSTPSHHSPITIPLVDAPQSPHHLTEDTGATAQSSDAVWMRNYQSSFLPHPPFPCPDHSCDSRFTTDLSFSEHMNRMHPNFSILFDPPFLLQTCSLDEGLPWTPEIKEHYFSVLHSLQLQSLLSLVQNAGPANTLNSSEVLIQTPLSESLRKLCSSNPLVEQYKLDPALIPIHRLRLKLFKDLMWKITISIQSIGKPLDHRNPPTVIKLKNTQKVSEHPPLGKPVPQSPGNPRISGEDRLSWTEKKRVERALLSLLIPAMLIPHFPYPMHVSEIPSQKPKSHNAKSKSQSRRRRPLVPAPSPLQSTQLQPKGNPSPCDSTPLTAMSPEITKTDQTQTADSVTEVESKQESDMSSLWRRYNQECCERVDDHANHSEIDILINLHPSTPLLGEDDSDSLYELPSTEPTSSSNSNSTRKQPSRHPKSKSKMNLPILHPLLRSHQSKRLLIDDDSDTLYEPSPYFKKLTSRPKRPTKSLVTPHPKSLIESLQFPANPSSVSNSDLFDKLRPHRAQSQPTLEPPLVQSQLAMGDPSSSLSLSTPLPVSDVAVDSSQIDTPINLHPSTPLLGEDDSATLSKPPSPKSTSPSNSDRPRTQPSRHPKSQSKMNLPILHPLLGSHSSKRLLNDDDSDSSHEPLLSPPKPKRKPQLKRSKPTPTPLTPSQPATVSFPHFPFPPAPRQSLRDDGGMGMKVCEVLERRKRMGWEGWNGELARKEAEFEDMHSQMRTLWGDAVRGMGRTGNEGVLERALEETKTRMRRVQAEERRKEEERRMGLEDRRGEWIRKQEIRKEKKLARMEAERQRKKLDEAVRAKEMLAKEAVHASWIEKREGRKAELSVQQFVKREMKRRRREKRAKEGSEGERCEDSGLSTLSNIDHQ
ncbi:hypothetical protein BLNAU_19911 [Blattamonas nauphoetae]|uniref:C2H2-type domain-containing protein n=1 Tax=Blattamonas nauphoetae TaxID=2049346 RepID=A0ABQ9X0F4_9EUKA|nr:hypothetical protein BLNAU_19911 [Blattamonas nauphoetae]